MLGKPGWRRRGFLKLLAAALTVGLLCPPGAEADAAPKKVAVKSSVIATVAYDEEAKTLDIEFRSGAVYRYAGVPADIFQKLLAAGSKGRFFGGHIRNHFEAERIE